MTMALDYLTRTGGPMRNALAAITVMLFCHAAYCDIAGGIIGGGTVTTSPATRDESTPAYNAVVSGIVPRAESIIRAPIPTAMSPDQRKDLLSQRDKDVCAIMKTAVGKSVAASFVVDSISSGSTTTQPNNQLARGGTTYTISGHITWLTNPILSNEDRDMIAKIKTYTERRMSILQQDLDAENKKTITHSTRGSIFTSTTVANPRLVKQLEDQIREYRNKMQADTAMIMRSGAPFRPVQTLQIITDDSNAAAWTAGSTHFVKGVLSSASPLYFSSSHQIDVSQLRGSYLGIGLNIRQPRTGPSSPIRLDEINDTSDLYVVMSGVIDARTETPH